MRLVDLKPFSYESNMQHLRRRPKFLVKGVMIIAGSARFPFLNDVKGFCFFLFGKGVLGFFLMTSLDLWLVQGWERRGKA
jgi:hypothetical protein